MNYDNLEIGISAKTTSAVNNIKKLSDSLSTLSSNLNKVDASKFASLSKGMQDLAVGVTALKNATQGGTNNIATLATNLKGLSNLSASALNGVIGAIKKLSDSFAGFNISGQALGSISILSNSLSKLGGANVTKAVAGMNNLTVALKNLLTEISKAPAVSNNVIKLIDSMARLTANGQKVSSTANTISRAFNSTGKSAFNLRFRFTSISSVIGRLYGELWLLIRAVKSLGSAIKSAMSYGETLNYFEKAFDDIASRSTEDWKNLGYESATEYYQALSDTLKAEAKGINEQLTGMTSNGKGFQVSTNKNLGLNTTDTLKAQTRFAQMSASMGVATDNATLLSNVMTKLGGDLASLYDTDFNSVWGNLQSGLAGMSRVMDKYGVNVRNANLNQTLLDLGIDTTVDKLGQEDKVLLRTIVMLKGTTSAWGDLAETLNSNANQLRLLQGNWQKLTTIIGSMFAPVLQKILPIINAVVVALQRLASFVAGLFGIEADFGSAIGGGLEDTSDYLDGIGGSADNASGAVKKLKNQLLGLDELNVISSKDNSGGGAGGIGGAGGKLNEAFLKATQEYLDAWQTAFDNMEDRITSIANQIENSKAFKTLKDLFVNLKEGNWKVVGKDVSELFIITTDSISKALEKVDWTQVGINIGNFLAGIEYGKIALSVGKLIWNVLKAVIDVYGALFWTTFFENPLGWKNLGTKSGELFAKYVFNPICKWIKEHVAPIVRWIEDKWIALVDFFNPKDITDILEKIETFVRDDLIPALMDSGRSVMLNLGIIVGGKVGEIIKNLEDKFSDSNIKAKISGLASGFLSKITEAKTNVTNKASEIISTLSSKFSAVSVGNVITGIKTAFTTAINDAKRVVETIVNNILKFINNIFGSSSSFTFSGLLSAFTSPFTSAISYLNDIINKINQINGMQVNVSASSVADFGANIINAVADVVKEETKKTPTSTKKDPGTYTNKASGSTAGMPSYAKKFADGGFPTVGTYFWAGEAGPEMLGTVGGKTAVASGSEITGISDTIRATSSAEMQLLRQQNELLMAILNKPGLTNDELFNSVRTSANNYTKTTGNLAF